MALLMHSAAHPGAHDARISSTGLVAGFIERENKGLSRLESFFLRTIFQNSTKSFPFGVVGVAEEDRIGDKIDEWQIDGFHSSVEEKNKRDAQGFSCFESLRKLLVTDEDTCLCYHSIVLLTVAAIVLHY